MSDREIELDPTCELFRKGDPEFRSMSPLSRWYMTIGGVIVGLGTISASNLVLRRPFYSGVQMYAFAGGLGFLAGEVANHFRNKVAAEKDFQYYHYMMLHPEDFPPPKKVLFRDYLEPWVPIR